MIKSPDFEVYPKSGDPIHVVNSMDKKLKVQAD
jgi:hypothetical protein